MKVIFHYDCGPWLETQLNSLAAEGLYVEVCSEDDETRFHYLLKTCDILWHVLKPVTADHINSAPELKLIQKIGVGVNTIGFKAAGQAQFLGLFTTLKTPDRPEVLLVFKSRGHGSR